MPIDPVLLAILACPSDDHAPLREGSDASGAQTLVCTFCASVFPVRDGIPVLLMDDAIPGPHGLGNAGAAESASGAVEPSQP